MDPIIRNINELLRRQGLSMETTKLLRLAKEAQETRSTPPGVLSLPTPRTDGRSTRITIECDDSCCSVRVFLDEVEYGGDLVDADFAKGLERELSETLSLLNKANISLDQRGL